MERHFTLISTLLCLLLGISNASITSSTGSEAPFSPLLRSSSSSSWSQQQQNLIQQSHTILPSGTRCHCNTSPPNSNDINIHPCVITNVNIREGSGLILYEVSYLDNEENLVEEYMPFMRVQRVHGRRNGSMLRASNVAAATAR